MVNPKQLLYFYLITVLKRRELYLLLIGAILLAAARPTPSETTATPIDSIPVLLTATEDPLPPPVVLTKVDSLLAVAESLIGVPYRYAGKRPSGFDCSGFTGYVYAQVGTPIGASSRHQFSQGTSVTIAQAQPGDLVFFSSKSKISHVGLITHRTGGDVYFIHASSSRGVVVDQLNDIYFRQRLAGFRRILPI